MPRAGADKDYYAILGIRREATEEEIRKAYRRLALEWHPDRRPGDPRAADRFKEISEAYAVLIDPAKRREYDEVSRAGATGAFRHSQEDLLRDLFADPRASGIFEDLAREFERMGMRVDGRTFRQTLFGGRAVVVGGVLASHRSPSCPRSSGSREPRSAAFTQPAPQQAARLGRFPRRDGGSSPRLRGQAGACSRDRGSWRRYPQETRPRT